MQFGDASEEQAVFRHGVVDTGTGEDETVVTSEARKKDGGGHQHASDGSQHLRHDRSSDTLFGGIFNAALKDGRGGGNSIERKNIQINEVAGDVEEDHHAGAEGERERQVAAGI